MKVVYNGHHMMKKLAKVGYRVAPMYNDVPNGTIIEVNSEILVTVKWDNIDQPTTEQIKYLRKAS
jgi:hypothetical protein